MSVKLVLKRHGKDIDWTRAHILGSDKASILCGDFFAEESLYVPNIDDVKTDSVCNECARKYVKRLAFAATIS